MPINTRPKSPKELNQFIPFVIKEIDRLNKSSENGLIEIVRTSKNKLDELSRSELLNILERLWDLWKKDYRFFDFRGTNNFPKQILTKPEKHEPLFEDYIFVSQDETEPISLKIFPNFNYGEAIYLVKKYFAVIQLSKSTRKKRLIKKQENNLNDNMSKIDQSNWKLPPGETFILRKIIKNGDPETFSNYKPKPMNVGDYKFYIVWNGSAPKDLKIKKPSQMDSLLNLFITSKIKNSIVSQKDIQKFLDTKQPPNRAVKDLNDTLVKSLSRKFPKEKALMSDLILGYSKKMDGYITKIPIIPTDDESFNILDKEDRPLEEPITEFLYDVGIIKRGI